VDLVCDEQTPAETFQQLIVHDDIAAVYGGENVFAEIAVLFFVQLQHVEPPFDTPPGYYKQTRGEFFVTVECVKPPARAIGYAAPENTQKPGESADEVW